MLRVKQLQAGALPPLSFEVGNGECLAVEGPSGAGKTRLLRAIADLDAAPGEVFLDGTERDEMTGPQWRQRVRFCAAEPAWWTDTPRSGFPSDTDETQLIHTLGAIGLEPDALDRHTAVLSTGERQRLALARAIVDEPQVLLLDEPTAALDPQAAARVEAVIEQQLRSGRSVILVSHDQDQIERLAGARLRLGKTTKEDAP